MRIALHILTIFPLVLAGCDDSTPSAKTARSSELTQEERHGIAILTRYASNLIGQEDFPDLDPYEPSPEWSIFSDILKDVCPNAMDAQVEVGGNAYPIAPQPKEFIAGDRTNSINLRVVRKLDTQGTIRHCEIEYDYTTLDGESGSIPATYLQIEKIIDGRKVHLTFSTKRTQQGADLDAETAP
ncbi:MAG: hypothetical protein RLZZ505_2305 [Verrucomicrobiota bacterium]|jgi:hypothetical protein